MDIVDTVYEQVLVRTKEGDTDIDIDKLPVMTWEGLKKINTDLMQVQNTYLQNWIGNFDFICFI